MRRKCILFPFYSILMIITFLQKITLFFLGFFLIAAIVQIGAIYYLSRPGREVAPAELIVVFPGHRERIAAGCDLAAMRYGRKLMVISHTADTTSKSCSKHYQQDSSKVVKTISGGKSRSTFEDVYNTIAAIEKYKITSVILVTSAYHLPRSAFLLKMSLALKGHKVTVQLHPVAETSLNSKKLQLYYNEFAKLIGSTAEMTGYFLTGHLMLDSPKFRKARTFLKKHVLLSL